MTECLRSEGDTVGGLVRRKRERKERSKKTTNGRRHRVTPNEYPQFIFTRNQDNQGRREGGREGGKTEEEARKEGRKRGAIIIHRYASSSSFSRASASAEKRDVVGAFLLLLLLSPPLVGRRLPETAASPAPSRYGRLCSVGHWF